MKGWGKKQTEKYKEIETTQDTEKIFQVTIFNTHTEKKLDSWKKNRMLWKI